MGPIRRTPRYNRGFTLIEMLVTLSIIVVISAVVLVSQRSFTSTILLTNTAYDIALSIRSAQVYGIGSRAFSLGTNPSQIGYGLQFKSSTPSSYLFFADSSPGPSASGACHTPPSGDSKAPDAKYGNCYYTSNDDKITTYQINNRFLISNFCGIDATGSSYCVSGGGTNGITELDVVFARPNTSASLAVRLSDGTLKLDLARACITVAAPAGSTYRYVRIYSTGEVDLTTSCP